MDDRAFLIEMGKRIAGRRKELKMTQEQVAEAVDLSLQSVSCIELGKKAIRPGNLVRLCAALDISADYLLTGQRSAKQLDGIVSQISRLREEDFRLVEELTKRLTK